jgi:2-keto-4-pentenoate hydratase/2-oxohepta-3-ene-1,7-dioic acid hydratase in catechol pathway
MEKSHFHWTNFQGAGQANCLRSILSLPPAALGPWLTTRDAVPDPHVLSIRMRVNANVVQNSNTSNLIFRIPALIAFTSAAITLEPGDIIATGTPDGVGHFTSLQYF